MCYYYGRHSGMVRGELKELWNYGIDESKESNTPDDPLLRHSNLIQQSNGVLSNQTRSAFPRTSRKKLI
ncbi:unnamed protein product [Arabis nemorensis]|uniref:Uncharacterized protein n=1 Tax=Arabis nemorensis TaxID=586526 RepID=A0A565BNH3_9BRAS|nr:unnamed protein product [Arabis nemorensis]